MWVHPNTGRPTPFAPEFSRCVCARVCGCWVILGSFCAVFFLFSCTSRSFLPSFLPRFSFRGKQITPACPCLPCLVVCGVFLFSSSCSFRLAAARANSQYYKDLTAFSTADPGNLFDMSPVPKIELLQPTHTCTKEPTPGPLPWSCPLVLSSGQRQGLEHWIITGICVSSPNRG